MSRAPASENLFIGGPAGQLEALLETPPDVADPATVAVVCHPHPLHGGTMKNKVAHTVARSFLDLGAAVLRFNFRGVGRSEGVFDDGRGELDDALAAIDWIQARWPRARPWLGGFSFGAGVSIEAASKRPVEWLVSVAPPVERMPLDRIRIPECPWLLLQGGADDVVDPQGVRQWASSISPKPVFEWFDGVGHFFHGNLNELRERIVRNAPRDE